MGWRPETRGKPGGNPGTDGTFSGSFPIWRNEWNRTGRTAAAVSPHKFSPPEKLENVPSVPGFRKEVSMKKRILIIVIILAAAGAAIWAFRGMGKTPDNRLMISGNIELEEVTIGFKTAGRLMERTVDEGDAVKKGQVIARLDHDQLSAQREREAAGLASSESQLAQAQTAVEYQRASLAADIETRQADLTSMQARFAELQNGARPQEKLDARAAVDAASSELDRAKRDWDRAQTLYKNDDISTAQFDQS